VYLIVLAVGANVLVIALGAMALARVRLARIQAQDDVAQARVLAASAVAQAVGVMNGPATNATWRQDYTSGVATTPVSFGGGQISFTLTDADGNLSDDPTDPVWIDGTGSVGGAQWVERAQARIHGGLPLACLRTALHCGGTLEIATGATLTASGGPVSTDTRLVVNGSVVGDAEATTISGSGSISGTASAPVDPKGLPPRSLFDTYKARATVLPFNGNLDTMVLSPGVNEYGGDLNADGVYSIDTQGASITIRNSRVWGTLLVDAGLGTVTLDGWNLMEPYRTDFPVLVVKGRLVSGPDTGSLQEAACVHNYNPPGAPYGGQTDADMTDTLPNEIRGLVHVIGSASLLDQGLYRGVILVDGGTDVAGTQTVTLDPNLMDDPPLGYTGDPNSTQMIVKKGTWTRRPAP